MASIQYTNRLNKVRLTGVLPRWDLNGPQDWYGYPLGSQQLADQSIPYDLAHGKGSKPQFDLVAEILQRCVVDFGYHDLYYVAGVSSRDTSSDVQYNDFFISNKRYEEILDIQPSNLASLYTGLFNKAKLTPRLSRDNYLSHYNMKGRVKPKLNDPDNFKYDEDVQEIGGLRYPVFSGPGNTPGNMCFGRMYFSGGIISTGNLLSLSQLDLIQTGDCIEVCKSLKGQIGFSQTYVSGNPFSIFGVNTYLLESFDYQLSHRKLTINYQYSTSNSRTGPFAHWEVTFAVSVTFSLEETGRRAEHLPDNYTEPTALVAIPRFSWELVKGFSRYIDEDHNIRTIGQNPYQNSLVCDDVVRQLSFPYGGMCGPFYSSTSTDGYTVDIDYLKFALQLSSSEHGFFWNEKKRLLQCAAIFAFQNALESHFKILDTNFDEVLSEIEGITEFVPDIQLLLQALSDLRRLRITGIIRLGDFITSTHLQYNFGTAPNIRAIQELNARGTKINELFNRGLESRTGIFQGSFSYRFLPEECKPYLDSRLAVKSSVSVTYCPTPFMKVLMDLYGIRVLPTLQNFWETLPFSFVADWFTNMGPRLRVLDLSALTLMCRVNNSEFTYRLTSPIPENSTLYKVMDSSSDIMHSTYFRDLTLHVPSLITETGIDYLRTAVNLNAGIFGSLVAQVGGSQLK